MKKIILLGLLIIIVGLFQKMDFFKITEIEYNKCEYMHEESIEIVLNDLNFFNDSKRVIKQKILEVPIVESVLVEKRFPNVLKLDIIYKQAFLKIIDNDILIITDDNGYVLSINKDIDTDYYLMGLEIAYYKINEKLETYNQEIFNNIFILIKLIKKSGIDIEKIIEYNDSNVCVSTLTGIEVEFGDCSQIERKFNDFINVYYDLVEKDVHYGVINVSITDLPLFRSTK
jgi:cell division septal protein FtsQ